MSASHQHGSSADQFPTDRADEPAVGSAPAPSDSQDVEVRVAAEPTQLAVLRAVVGDLAMRADFDVDSIADLRLAVDEACSSLIRLAQVNASLVCRFGSRDGHLAVTAEVTSDNAAEPRKDTFSWRVLSALTDTVSTSVESAESGSRVRIDLSKGRTSG